MNTFKRMLTVVLSLIMITFIFVSCSNTTSTSDNVAQETQATEESVETSEDVINLTFSMWDPMPEDYNFVNAFMQANPDIKVEIVSFPDENYSTKLNTMAATDSEPDVMLVWESDINNFAQNDVIINLDDYVSGSELVNLDDLFPAMATLQEMNGATYGLPWGYAVQMMYYNKDMFDAAGIDYPSDDWTWDDYKEAAVALTVREGENTIQWGEASIGHKGAWYSMVGAGGDDVINADGTLDIGEGTKNALQFQYDLINTLKVSPEISASGSDTSDLFAAGRAAMVRTGSWMTSAYRELPFNWDIAPLPAGERDYAQLHTGFYTISNNCENPDAAWRFVEYCMSPEGQEIIVQGFGNPSAVASINEMKYHEKAGENGPTNWGAFDTSTEVGNFGFTLLPSGVTDDLQKKFEAAVMGQITIDEAIETGVEQANEILNS